MAPVLLNRPRGLADPRRPTAYRFPEFGVPLFGKAHFYPPSCRYAGNSYRPMVAGPSCSPHGTGWPLAVIGNEIRTAGSRHFVFILRRRLNGRGAQLSKPEEPCNMSMFPARLPDSATIYPCCPLHELKDGGSKEDANPLKCP
ncbi:hypothetical protein EJ05DRAFT_501779 [Pseudovirgaria hyperparasitica]|uniref:Uncharacterized protein n=1 Tax=Pseudovirgaria hyperparasitica TaxID=470096 RepID=A0A6A6W846_9PEZI|nr:uncharacterized protein EJ05DRAFT_501779 [Pseudovirgaria hyperparasitica]KAF2757251.1 hypothetical protein EJ05DRAFT_501779 [Pseudovirgaria hyperparasitica]